MNRHDDTNDIMAAIMGNARAGSPATAPQKAEEKVRATDNTRHKNRVKGSARASKRVLGMLVGLIILGAVMAGVALAYSQRDKLTNLLAPASPFNEEVTAKVEFPLYYPAKLPAGFKIEKDSVTTPESDVVLYRVSDDGGRNFTISVQPRNANVNYDTLFGEESDAKTYETQNGKIIVGNMLNNTVAGHFVTEKTWVIVNGSVNALSLDDAKFILENLRTN